MAINMIVDLLLQLSDPLLEPNNMLFDARNQFGLACKTVGLDPILFLLAHILQYQDAITHFLE